MSTQTATSTPNPAIVRASAQRARYNATPAPIRAKRMGIGLIADRKAGGKKR